MVDQRVARPPPLVLAPRLRIACTVLQIVPLPGLGAIIAGSRNPHSGLRGRGIAQLLLVVAGSWPLVLPGVAGLLWAIVDAVRIHRNARPPGKASRPILGVIPKEDPEHPHNRRRSRSSRRRRRSTRDGPRRFRLPRAPWRRRQTAGTKGRPPLGPT